MIAREMLLLDGARSLPEAEESPSVPILEAALEIGRRDRERLEQQLLHRAQEATGLREEVERLRSVLAEREAAIAALTEQASRSVLLANQVTQQVSCSTPKKRSSVRPSVPCGSVGSASGLFSA